MRRLAELPAGSIAVLASESDVRRFLTLPSTRRAASVNLTTALPTPAFDRAATPSPSSVLPSRRENDTTHCSEQTNSTFKRLALPSAASDFGVRTADRKAGAKLSSGAGAGDPAGPGGPGGPA